MRLFGNPFWVRTKLDFAAKKHLKAIASTTQKPERTEPKQQGNHTHGNTKTN